MFNTKEFAWHNIEIAILGRPVTGARGVKYSVKQEKEALHARGQNPFSIQSGNKTFEGELMLLQSSLEAIARQLEPGQDLTDLEMNITIAYIPKDGIQVVTHILHGVEFMEDNRGMNQNDKFADITLPFIFLRREII